MKIEGLQVAEGIRNCGSEDLFLALLGDFYKLIDGKSAKIEEYLRTEQLRDYTIEVHGLKNRARIIGVADAYDAMTSKHLSIKIRTMSYTSKMLIYSLKIVQK